MKKIKALKEEQNVLSWPISLFVVQRDSSAFQINPIIVRRSLSVSAVQTQKEIWVQDQPNPCKRCFLGI